MNQNPAPPPAEEISARVLRLAVACSLLTGAAHLLIKWSADRSRALGWTDPGVLLPLTAAYALMGIGLLVLLLALRTGALSMVYPVLSARYVWIVAVAPLLFSTESWNLPKLLGAAVVALGVLTVAHGEPRG